VFASIVFGKKKSNEQNLKTKIALKSGKLTLERKSSKN